MATILKSIVFSLAQNEHLQNLFILPTCGTKFYRYHLNWQLLYSEDFTVLERDKISNALQYTVDKTGFIETKIWFEIIEDRGS